MSAFGQLQTLKFKVMAMKFRQYDVVKLKKLLAPTVNSYDEFNSRRPLVGDVATIIEVYEEPPGYELECSDQNGNTVWLIAFRPEDIELELVP
ncbi:DUF4926 domain-containing protein [Undibacterium sp. CY7W]|uniref:DUF4926 domain-containing protein n=2 Tax=Undibacterium rugosum TaxID=2762291 RepID=A0A923I335_9BURK|nr:DUF4926 domain-containing protein [Undibacterium rugosum]